MYIEVDQHRHHEPCVTLSGHLYVRPGGMFGQTAVDVGVCVPGTDEFVAIGSARKAVELAIARIKMSLDLFGTIQGPSEKLLPKWKNNLAYLENLLLFEGPVEYQENFIDHVIDHTNEEDEEADTKDNRESMKPVAPTGA